MKVLGLDLSIQSTGIVCLGLRDRPVYSEVVHPPTNKEAILEARIDHVLRRIQAVNKKWQPDIIGIEDTAYSRVQKAAMLGELNGTIKHWIWKQQIPWLPVNVRSARKHLIGNGAAKKEEVLRHVQTLDPRILSHDIADALCVAIYVRDRYADLVEVVG